MMKRGWQNLKHTFQSLYATTRYYVELAQRHRVSPSTAYKRRRYYASWICPQNVPPYSVSFLPNDFCARQVANTGLSIVDNFCTPEEASYLIKCTQDRLKPSTMTVNYQNILTSRRTSETATVFSEDRWDPAVLPLLHRGSMLVGLPYNHVEAVYVTRYQAGQKFDSHTDFYPGYNGDRLYTILIYLNDLSGDQGGETIFEDLRVSVQPKLGRAIIWTNKNPDGSVHDETRHAAAPVSTHAEKWVIQLWFRRYKMFDPPNDSNHLTFPSTLGQSLQGHEVLPLGVSKLSSADRKLPSEYRQDQRGSETICVPSQQFGGVVR